MTIARRWTVAGIFLAGLAVVGGRAGITAADEVGDGAVTTAPAGPAPTVAELRAMAAAKKYDDALAGIKRVLDPNNKADYDRTAVMMLRAECQVQLKQFQMALGTLETVRKQAVKDANQKDEDTASVLWFVISKSTDGKYAPKSVDDKTTIDILDGESRKRAYAALFVDELAVLKQLVDATADGTNMAALVKATDETVRTHGLERFLSGKTPKTNALIKKIPGAVVRMVAQGENDYGLEISQISAASHAKITEKETVIGKKKPVTKSVKEQAGLSLGGENELGKIIADCQKIIDYVAVLRGLLDNPDLLINAQSRAVRLQTRAQTVLGGGVDPNKTLPPAEKDKPAPKGGQAATTDTE